MMRGGSRWGNVWNKSGDGNMIRWDLLHGSAYFVYF